MVEPRAEFNGFPIILPINPKHFQVYVSADQFKAYRDSG
jgi:hypothetical protein